ncbi:MAG: DUF305 domain-containing protein, partial [Candidatus Acidiferrales bacterium]
MFRLASKWLARPVRRARNVASGTAPGRRHNLHFPRISVLLGVAFLAALALAVHFPTAALAQQSDSAAAPAQAPAPAVVQPGAPGQPTKKLPASTKGALPPPSPADVAFMQGMIMHHSQAVIMTAWIPTHTENKNLRLLGARISRSQSDEISFMRRWLAARGEPDSMSMQGMPGMDKS